MNLLVLFALFVHAAFANTEKSIFIAPPSIILPSAGPALEHLRLDTLSPTSSSLRRALTVAFPTKNNPRGRESWYLLQHLSEDQRYEIRVCWVATQPTEFRLDVYNLTHVFDTPQLIQSLATFADEQLLRPEQTPPSTPNDILSSVSFLRIRAAADFFSTNKTLMQRPPVVDVDIILDPYLFNIFPASLLPTAAYIVILAVSGWFISSVLWNFLRAQDPPKVRND